ncbi:MAG: peptide chain release factor N(5)-glutamine methyltransferase [Anaerohalosphaeraceae bacterium]|nr:peptide chain release factor N(5)-glutamine methyltransferase [Anaerohalosphaeraceae bacterium]
MEQWTIKKLLDWMVDYFQAKAIDSARLSAEMLISSVLGMKRIELYMHFDKVVAPDKLARLRELVKRCIANEPVQYLVGSCEFYSMTIKISPDCLVPRPETELLVERAIEFLRNHAPSQSVCDLCTGSGCVAIAIASGCKDAKIIATDICDKALAVAAENLARHDLQNRVELLCGDLFQPVIAELNGEPFALITVNPPYVTTSEMESLEDNVRKYEPALALHGGVEGLDIYCRIIAGVDPHLKSGGALIMEIGCAQGDAIKQMLKSTGIFKEIKVEKDFSNNDRIVTAIKK